MKALIYVLVVASVAVANDDNLVLRVFLEDHIAGVTDQFSTKMLKEVVKQEPATSVVMSGLSAMSPLAQLGLAAVGDSHDEIINVLGLYNDIFTKEAFTLVNKQIANISSVDLKLVNRIYMAEGNELDDQFASVTNDVFRSDVQEIDFSDNFRAAATINDWVANKTNSRIKDLIKPESLDQSTQVVIVNAIYFKGSWDSKFDKELTEDRDFYVSKDLIIQVPTMHQEGSFLYGSSEELNARLLELFFQGRESSLLIVLPNKVDGLHEVHEKMLERPDLLRFEANNMDDTKVLLYLPKFKVETTLDLRRVLEKMGVNKLFDAEEARLENFLKNNIHGPEINKAIQKAFIEVNEEGAEAAAASAFWGNRILSENVVFRVNRPFLFQLRVGSIPVFHGIYRP